VTTGADGHRNYIASLNNPTADSRLKSSPPTNQHAAFYGPNALPVTQSTVSEQ